MIALTRRQLMAGTALVGAGAMLRPGLQALAQIRSTHTIDLYCSFVARVIDGKTCLLRAYRYKADEQPQIPGPLMNIRPGERLVINVINELAPYDSRRWDRDNHNVPHDLGSTNLHLHGMNVIPHLFEPLGTSDPQAPMIRIRPGERKTYVFDIPANHPPGFNWYHPHHHGSTVVQAATGMAGGIVVHGAIDDLPDIKAARDIPLVMQDIGLFPADEAETIWTYLPKQNAIWQTFSGDVTIYDPQTKEPVKTGLKDGFSTGDYRLRYFLINGEAYFREEHNPQIPPSGQPTPIGTQLAAPEIRMKPGEVVRFRMLNGNSDNYMPIIVTGHELHLLAYDGVNFPEVRTIPAPPSVLDASYQGQLQLAPANRAEFMTKASSTPGAYPIVQLAQAQQFLYSAQKTIATIVVEDAPPVTMGLPTKLPRPVREYPLIRPEEIVARRTFVFADAFPGVQNPVVGIDFTINKTQYHEEQVHTRVQLGTAEEWTLVVPDKAQGGSEGHPFHIHINSFEVIEANGQKLEPGTIKDTVWIEQNSKVVMRTRFQQFTGKTVFHCHILPHEDTGMMHNFIVQREPVTKAGELDPYAWPICTALPG